MPTPRAAEIGARVEAFVREVVAPFEHDPRRGSHGLSDALVDELKALALRGGRVDTAHPF